MKSRQGILAALSRKHTLDAGVTTIEYAIMLVLVSIAVATFGLGMGGSVNSVFSRMVLALADDAGDSGGDGGGGHPSNKDKTGTCCD